MSIPKETVDRLLQENRDHVCPGHEEICVRLQAVADLPTRFGQYQAVAFWNNSDRKDHAAFVHGNVFEMEEVPVRVHSECLTGDAIGSLRCDCRDQLIESLASDRGDGERDRGLPAPGGSGDRPHEQDPRLPAPGRGVRHRPGQRHAWLPPDERDYAIAAHMLGTLHVKSIRLMTNNPQKVASLERHGVTVVGRIPLVIPPNAYNGAYLETKRKRLGHLLDVEQGDDPVTNSE